MFAVRVRTRVTAKLPPVVKTRGLHAVCDIYCAVIFVQREFARLWSNGITHTSWSALYGGVEQKPAHLDGCLLVVLIEFFEVAGSL